MIDHKLKVVFMHPCRTGGATIESVLGLPTNRKQNGDTSRYQFISHDPTLGYMQHARYMEMEKYIPSTYYKIATVRNPYNRVLGMIRYTKMPSFRALVDFCEKSVNMRNFVLPQHMYTHKNGVCVVDDIIRICDGERVGLDALQEKTGLVIDIPEYQPTVNTYEFSSDDISLIQKMYADDFRLLGYDINK